MAEPEGLISFPITLPNPAAALAIAGDEQSTALHRLEALTGASIVLRGLDLVIRARPNQLERAAALGLRTRVIFLHCPLDVARARNASRPRSLPDEVIVSSIESSRRLFELLRDVCDVSEEHDTRKHQPSRKGRRASLTEVAVTSFKIKDSVHRLM